MAMMRSMSSGMGSLSVDRFNRLIAHEEAAGQVVHSFVVVALAGGGEVALAAGRQRTTFSCLV